MHRPEPPSQTRRQPGQRERGHRARVQDVARTTDLVRSGRNLEQTPGLVDADVADDVGSTHAALPFDFYAYPVNGIPSFRQIGPEVERSIVCAFVRQESAFNPSVVSPAQAYGLMQVAPDAARHVWRTCFYRASFGGGTKLQIEADLRCGSTE